MIESAPVPSPTPTLWANGDAMSYLVTRRGESWAYPVGFSSIGKILLQDSVVLSSLPPCLPAVQPTSSISNARADRLTVRPSSSPAHGIAFLLTSARLGGSCLEHDTVRNICISSQHSGHGLLATAVASLGICVQLLDHVPCPANKYPFVFDQLRRPRPFWSLFSPLGKRWAKRTSTNQSWSCWSDNLG